MTPITLTDATESAPEAKGPWWAKYLTASALAGYLVYSLVADFKVEQRRAAEEDRAGRAEILTEVRAQSSAIARQGDANERYNRANLNMFYAICLNGSKDDRQRSLCNAARSGSAAWEK